ncbi:MAG: glycosyltransferase [Acetobacteraceae bacterium]|nr:glycosyltransferase [Acetobacteraceae bacterium]
MRWHGCVPTEYCARDGVSGLLGIDLFTILTWVVLVGGVLAVVPSVCMVVPARDEAAHVGAVLRSLLVQGDAGKFPAILVDDGSMDGAGDIARVLGDSRLTMIFGAARPEGWIRKLWAVV